MALDLETVADTYFKGYADPTPRGVVGTANTGYAFPIAEWSDEIRGYYSYDPEGAERLLDEAGAEFGPMTADASLYEGMLWFISGFNAPLPVTTVGWQATGAYNNATGHSASEYDAMIAAIGSAKTVEEERQLIQWIWWSRDS